jgi:hypothetical protein
MQTESHVVFPETATIQLVSGRPLSPLPLAGVVCVVRLVARVKNDYRLGPFLSDAEGVVHITRAACQALVEAEHDSGLMDYAGVEQCDAQVEIRVLTGAEVKEAAGARRTVWRTLLRGEDRVFASIDALVASYAGAPNGRLTAGPPLTPYWDGSNLAPYYAYVIDHVAPP